MQRNLPGLEPIPQEIRSAADGFHYVPPKSSQYYQVVSEKAMQHIFFHTVKKYTHRQVPRDQSPDDLIGRPIVHASAYKQATGEAVYCDDIPQLAGELYLALVLSTKAHANIVRIDASKALELDGVVAFYSAEDVPEQNRWVGPVFHDEEVFVSKKVIYKFPTQGEGKMLHVPRCSFCGFPTVLIFLRKNENSSPM